MESITNSSYYGKEGRNTDTEGNHFNMLTSADVPGFELNDSKPNSNSYVSVINTANMNTCPEVMVSDCDSTSIVISSEIDSKVQTVAQIFVEDLLFRAQKEVRSKLDVQSQVIS